MPKFRSPVLGFNHNIRHRGWMFHVQTEDSGLANPRIFTHLFHDGVIIGSKKVEYDADSDPEVVRSLMQAQHKAVMRELKAGGYDDKIGKYLGEAPAPPEPEPSQEPPRAEDVLEGRSDEDSLPYAQIIVEGEAVVVSGEVITKTTAPLEAAASPTLPQPDMAAQVAAQHQAEPQPDDDDLLVSDVFRKIAQAPAPPPQPQPEASSVWMVSRPGRAERPFDKSGQAPVIKAPRAGTRAPAPGERSPGHLPEVVAPPVPGYAPRARRAPQNLTAIAGADAATPPVVPPRAPSGPVRPLPPPITIGGSTATRPLPPPAPARGPGTQPPRGRGGEGVVVARPAVVIGAPPTVVGGGAPTPPVESRRTNRDPTPPPGDSIFGQDLISEKSLDEVIMAYLSEDASEE